MVFPSYSDLDPDMLTRFDIELPPIELSSIDVSTSAKSELDETINTKSKSILDYTDLIKPPLKLTLPSSLPPLVRNSPSPYSPSHFKNFLCKSDSLEMMVPYSPTITSPTEESLPDPTLSHPIKSKNDMLKESLLKGDIQCAKKCLEEGADPNLEFYDPAGLTNKPIYFAIENSNIEMVKLLIEFKADLNTPDFYNCSPLMLALDNPAILKILIEADANVNQTDNLLLFTILSNNVVAFEILLTCPKIQTNYICKGTGNNLLILALEKASTTPVDFKILELLIKKVDVNYKHPMEIGITALTIALLNEKLPRDQKLLLIKLLIDAKADLNHKDKNGHSPLQIAYAFREMEIFKALIQAGADLNQANNSGNTVLHLACRDDKDSYYQLLVLHGANVDAINNSGQTPSHLTKNKWCKELLKEKGNISLWEELEMRKYVAHVWGIKSNSKIKNGADKELTFDLEYGYSHNFVPQMSSTLNDFLFAKLPDHLLSFKNRALIKEAFDQSAKLDHLYTPEIINRIAAGSPVILNYLKEEHFVSIVFYKNQVIICNRGFGKTANAIEIYEIPKSFDYEKMLNVLKGCSQVKVIYDFVAEKKLVHKKSIFQKSQKINNCALASPKSALLGLLYVLTNDLAKSGKIYKAFTYYQRLESFKNYKKYSRNPDNNLISEIQKKVGKKEARAHAYGVL